MENNTDFKNITAAEKDNLVSRLTDDEFRRMIPILLYMVILMVFGFVGNSMVLFYYRFKSRVTTFSIFVSMLAAYDLLVCVLTMPIEITRIVLYYTFKLSILCKILRFCNYFASAGSCLALVVIAADRYRRICKWSAVQMNTRHANISCLITAVIAFSLEWPSLVLYDLQEISIPNEYGVELRGTICTGTWNEINKPYVNAFYTVNLAIIIMSGLIVTLLYCAVGLKLIVHKRRLMRNRKNTLTSAKQTRSHSPEKSMDLDADSAGVREPLPDIQNTRRPTIMLATVTILFIISFIPLFAMLFWRQSVGKHQVEFLSGTGLVAYEVAITSFLISSAINPWVYGTMCAEFRQYFIERFRGIFKSY